jgi:hypothetical protein
MFPLHVQTGYSDGYLCTPWHWHSGRPHMGRGSWEGCALHLAQGIRASSSNPRKKQNERRGSLRLRLKRRARVFSSTPSRGAHSWTRPSAVLPSWRFSGAEVGEAGQKRSSRKILESRLSLIIGSAIGYRASGSKIHLHFTSLSFEVLASGVSQNV